MSPGSLKLRRGAKVLTLCDLPVLEPDWPRTLEERTMFGPVIALLGFADRAMVGRARESGAAACLDLPVDANDLVHVILRVNREFRSGSANKAESRIEPAKRSPPPPASRAQRGRAAIQRRATPLPLWSEEKIPSRIKNEKPT